MKDEAQAKFQNVRISAPAIWKTKVLQSSVIPWCKKNLECVVAWTIKTMRKVERASIRFWWTCVIYLDICRPVISLIGPCAFYSTACLSFRERLRRWMRENLSVTLWKKGQVSHCIRARSFESPGLIISFKSAHN